MPALPRTAAVVALTIVLSTPLAAQRRARLDVALPPAASQATDGPLVRGADILADGQLRDLLHNGFPARLHFRVELWSAGGLFNDLARATEWEVRVRFDPLDRTYRAVRVAGGEVTPLGPFTQFGEVTAAVERAFQPRIAPPRRGRRYYYAATLDVETLSLSDLDEVDRWLRGELRPAVRGRRNPGTALTRGLRTLVVRLLGGERRHYEARTGTFRP